ncbi:hypothetical protein [Halobacterium yunchengense]|uniref:hypothetical protein n=1 Tax=Halobacterium yunchengense TaxID=3108497 RepID=UPI00300B6E4E
MTEETESPADRRGAGRARPATVSLYLLGALGLGVTALFGGGALLVDPTGESLRLPLEWLDGTPFSDYAVPGLVLFGVLGVGSFAVAAGVVLGRSWAWPASVGLGVALSGWIVVQVLLVRQVTWLQAVYGGLGLLLVGLALTASFRAAVAR